MISFRLDHLFLSDKLYDDSVRSHHPVGTQHAPLDRIRTSFRSRRPSPSRVCRLSEGVVIDVSHVAVLPQISITCSVYVKGDCQRGSLGLQLVDLLGGWSPALFPLHGPGLCPEQSATFTTAHSTPGSLIVTRPHQALADWTR